MWPPSPSRDSDACNYDRARDDLAVPDPFATEWETHPHHGLIKPEDVPAQFAGTPLNASIAWEPGVERQPAGAQSASPSSQGAGWARGNPYHSLTVEGARMGVQHNTATLLRAIAAWIDSHPDADIDAVQLDTVLPGNTVRCYGVKDAADLADRARRLGGTWQKETDDVGLFRLRQEIAPGVFYELIANRDDVCERVQVGETTVTEPDPAAVERVPVVERVVPVYEYRCAPILGHKS